MSTLSTVDTARHMGELTDSAADIMGVACVGLLLADGGGRLRAVSSSGLAVISLEVAQGAVAAGPLVDAHRVGRPVAVSDVLAVDAYAPVFRRSRPWGVRAVLAVPVRCGDVVVGNLSAVDPDPHPWGDRHTAALLTFAGLVADLLILSAAGADVGVEEMGRRLAEVDGVAA